MLFLILLSCTEKEEKTEYEKPTNIVSVSYPAEFLVQRLLPSVSSSCLLPKTEDPMHWNPKPEQIASLASGTLIVAVGVGYEAWMQTAALPSRNVVSFSSGLPLLQQTGKTHSHGKSGEHSHSGYDPFIWMDPSLYYQQAENLHRSLKQIFPNTSAQLSKNLQTLQVDLEGLSVKLEQQKNRIAKYKMISNQGNYSYLAHRWKVDIHDFSFSDLGPESKALGLKNKENFMLWYQAEEPTLMLWTFPPSEALKNDFPTDIQHVYFDPLTNPVNGEQYNYIQQFTENLSRLGAL